MIRQSLLVGCMFFMIAATHATEHASCEPLVFKKNGPPFDYHDPSALARERLRLAEGAHFTESVRAGIAGNAGSLIGDLDFVLKVFPNHPYALAVMAKVQLRPGFSRQHPMRRDYYYPTMNCYFERALQMAPSDSNVYVVLAIHEHRQKHYENAKSHYLKAIAINADSAEAHYNLGLLLFTMGESEDALKHAHAAYALGYPLSGLRDKLQSKGVWREPNVVNAAGSNVESGR